MTVSRRRLGVLGVCALCATGLAYFASAAETTEIKLKGGAIWNGNHKRADLKAVLTPSATGTNEYTVVYTVVWEGSTQTWKGTMRGALRSGNVSGTGATPDGRRTFIFQARVSGGVMVGKHYETTGGGTPKLTGDIGLKPDK